MSSKRPISLPDGFEHTTLRIPISEIMPLREVPSSVRKSVKYKQIGLCNLRSGNSDLG
jgi:hypothetical protein